VAPILAPLFLDQTPTSQTSTLSLHDALPISALVLEDRHEVAQRLARMVQVRQGVDDRHRRAAGQLHHVAVGKGADHDAVHVAGRSEEHTSELQSRENLVCRLLLEKKKKNDMQ